MPGTDNAAWWFWAPFLGAFGLIGFWETFAPLRHSPVSTPLRWAVNAVLLGLANLAQAVVLRASPGVAAMASSAAGFGLLPQSGFPLAAQWVAAILALDLMRYLQHVGAHKVGLLWRMHQVHHADPHYDLTTGLRFHPLEALFNNGTYLVFVSLLGPPVLATLIVEAAAGFQSLFAHANANLPAGFDRHLRRIWITPNLHRVHHSTDRAEQNSNFGVLLPVWDMIFGTYRAAPRLPQEMMPVGLDGLSRRDASNVLTLLAMPFRRRP